MTDYYGYQHSYAVPYTSGFYRDEMEYGGYDNVWALGRHSRYSSRYGDYDAHHHDHSWPRSQSRSYVHHQPAHDVYDYNPVRYSLPTEDEVTIKMTICCEGCRWKLDESLRKVTGVYDVRIVGQSDALVTVSGSAAPFKILERARKISKSAEMWSSSTRGHYSRWY